MLLVPWFGPGSGIVINQESNLWNPEAAVSTDLLQLLMHDLDTAKEALFAHYRKRTNLGNTKAQENVLKHDFRIWLSCYCRSSSPDEVGG